MAQSGVVNGCPKSLASPYIVNNPFRFGQHKGKERSSKIFSRALGPKLMALSHFMPSRDKQSKTISETNANSDKSSTKQDENISSNVSPINEFGSTLSVTCNDAKRVDSGVQITVGDSTVNTEQQNNHLNLDNAQITTSGEMKNNARNGFTSNGSLKSNQEDDKQVPKAKANGVMKKAKPNGFTRRKVLVKPQCATGENSNGLLGKGTESENKGTTLRGPASQDNGVVSCIDDIQSESNELQNIHLGGNKRRVIKRPPANNRISAPASTVQGTKVSKRITPRVNKEPKDTLKSNETTAPVTSVSGQSRNTHKASILSSPSTNIFQKSLAERIKEQHLLTGFIVGPKSECYNIGSQATIDSNDRRHGESALQKSKSDNESDQSFESPKPMSVASGEGNNTSTTSIASSQETMLRKHCPDLTPVEGENSSPIVKRKQWRRALDH